MKKLILLLCLLSPLMWGQKTKLDLAKQTKGTLAVVRGGTGRTALCLNNEIMVSNGTVYNCIVSTATPTANAIVKADGSGNIAEGWIPTTLTQAYTIESGATPLTLKRTGLTVIFTLQSTSVGDTIIDFKNDGDQTYRIFADRSNDDFRIGTSGTPKMLFAKDAAIDRTGAGAAFVMFSVTHANLPATENGSMVYCSDCTRGSVACTSGGAGSMAKRENSAWNCD